MQITKVGWQWRGQMFMRTTCSHFQTKGIFSPTIWVCLTRKVSSQLQERQIQWQRRQKNSNCGEPPQERCAQDGVFQADSSGDEERSPRCARGLSGMR